MPLAGFVFQACSFNHSDISPCLAINSLQRQRNPQKPDCEVNVKRLPLRRMRGAMRGGAAVPYLDGYTRLDETRRRTSARLPRLRRPSSASLRGFGGSGGLHRTRWSRRGRRHAPLLPLRCVWSEVPGRRWRWTDGNAAEPELVATREDLPELWLRDARREDCCWTCAPKRSATVWWQLQPRRNDVGVALRQMRCDGRFQARRRARIQLRPRTPNRFAQRARRGACDAVVHQRF